MDLVTSFTETLWQMLGSGDWFEIALAFFMILIFACIAGLILWGVFYAIDSWFLPVVHDAGVINGHDFTPAHTVMTMMPTTNGGMVPVPVYHPDSWSVGVSVGERHSWMGCTREYHDRVKDGQKVTVYHKNGRLSGRMYVESLMSV